MTSLRMGLLVSPVAVPFARGVCFRDVEGAIPYHVRDSPPLRLQSETQDKARCPNPWGGEMRISLSARPHFVKQTERQYVADCRGRVLDIVSRVSSWAGVPSRECVSTRLFPRSGIQWRHFLVPSFFAKKAECYAKSRRVCSQSTNIRRRRECAHRSLYEILRRHIR